MGLIGHWNIQSSLRQSLGKVTVFQGPQSVGKWTFAEDVRKNYRIAAADVLRLHHLTVEDVETVRTFVRTPAIGAMKLVIVEVDRSALPQQEALAGIIDSSYATFIIIGQRVAEALTTRAQVYRFGYLSDTDVADILIQEKKLDADLARDLAVQAGGMVWPAMKLIESDDEVHKTVVAAISAMVSRDAEALDELATRWTDEATDLLTTWCSESITGRWRLFKAEEGVTGKGLPLRILLSIEPDVRPRLVVRSQLMSILKES